MKELCVLDRVVGVTSDSTVGNPETVMKFNFIVIFDSRITRYAFRPVGISQEKAHSIPKDDLALTKSQPARSVRRLLTVTDQFSVTVAFLLDTFYVDPVTLFRFVSMDLFL